MIERRDASGCSLSRLLESEVVSEGLCPVFRQYGSDAHKVVELPSEKGMHLRPWAWVKRHLDLHQKKKLLLSPPWWSQRLRRQKLPKDVVRYLTHTNSRLVELKARYGELRLFDHSFWELQSRRIDLHRFRGEWNFLAQVDYWQTRQKYMMTASYITALDDERFLERLTEDSLFGAITFKVLDDLVVSRDLLDSVLEIRFLVRSLGLTPEGGWTSLDIGAGYGRLAHRLTALFPRGNVFCVDGVAVSTFLCEFYTRFRGCEGRAHTVPVYETSSLSNLRFDFATNIHSWSECTLATVRFWLDLLTDLRVRYLFVVPHEAQFLTHETDGSKVSFLPEIKRHGYGLVRMEAKYADCRLMAAYGLFNAPYALFELGP